MFCWDTSFSKIGTVSKFRYELDMLAWKDWLVSHWEEDHYKNLVQWYHSMIFYNIDIDAAEPCLNVVQLNPRTAAMMAALDESNYEYEYNNSSSTLEEVEENEEPNQDGSMIPESLRSLPQIHANHSSRDHSPASQVQASTTDNSMPAASQESPTLSETPALLKSEKQASADPRSDLDARAEPEHDSPTVEKGVQHSCLSSLYFSAY